MKILIPSAKELNEKGRTVVPKPLSPQTKQILQSLGDFSLEDLASFYAISEERAQVERERIEALPWSMEGPSLILPWNCLMVSCTAVWSEKTYPTKSRPIFQSIC